MKMVLGMEADLNPGDFVLDGDPTLLPKKGAEPPPQFSAYFYCGQMAGCIKTPLGMEVGVGPGDFVLDVDPDPLPKKGAEPPIFGPCLLQPNGCMDQDATWYGGRPRPTRHCVRWGPSSSSPKGTQPPIFGQYPWWPNGWMDKDATWCGGRPQPMRLCVRWGSSYSQKEEHTHPTQFLAHVCCGQTSGWMKTPLATEVDLDPGHIVLNGVPALRERGTAAPFFGPFILWPRSPISA